MRSRRRRTRSRIRGRPSEIFRAVPCFPRSLFSKVTTEHTEHTERMDPNNALLKKPLFIFLIIFCLTPWASPPIALALGLLLAFTGGSPFPEASGKPTKYLLQA